MPPRRGVDDPEAVNDFLAMIGGTPLPVPVEAEEPKPKVRQMYPVYKPRPPQANTSRRRPYSPQVSSLTD